MVFPLIMAAGAVAGIGLSVMGGMQSTAGAKASADAQKEITKQEMEAEKVRMRAMELDARRRSLEVIRTQQRARSMGLATATAQGAQKGSGLQGAFGQFSGASGFNFSGIQANLGFGQEMFGINQLIGQQKINMAGAQSQIAQGQALSSLGGSIMNSLGAIGGLSGGFGGGGGGQLTSFNVGNQTFPMYS